MCAQRGIAPYLQAVPIEYVLINRMRIEIDAIHWVALNRDIILDYSVHNLET